MFTSVYKSLIENVADLRINLDKMKIEEFCIN